MSGSPPNAVRVIGVPMDFGADRRGVDMGPSAIRYARLASALEGLGLACQDAGNLDTPLPETEGSSDPKLKHLPSILAVCQRLKESVCDALAAGEFPLVLGGDHSLAVGTLAAVGAHWDRPGVLWVDAHGDFNTPETTPSGNVHGMPLAVSTGRGAPALRALFERFIAPERVALVGVRALDPGERRLLREAGVAVFTMTEVDRHGLPTVMRQALARLGEAEAVHLSLDMDALDPDIAPGVGTPVEGGLSYREAHLAMELVAESGRLRSLEVVEVNPILDERNRTGRLAVELIASALGKRIF